MNKCKQYDNKIILPRAEKRESPKGKLGLVFCRDCNAVYYKKSWHKNLHYYKSLKEDLALSFSLCPACQMVKNRQFEGKIIINNIPVNIEESLIHLIETFGRRAEQRDNQDRIISIKKNKAGLTITTTENQLAVKIAKKIKDVFKKVEMKISYSSHPSDVAYVKLEFRI